MTKLGEYLARRSVSKAEIGRKTGLTRQRVSELCLSDKAQLKLEEFYLIGLAIKADPLDMLKELCGHLNLIDEDLSNNKK